MNTPLPVKVLLVDDLDDNLLVLKALLTQDGVEFLSARSGPEALELLLVHDVALALLDVQMPEMDGFELAELMRGAERTRRVPIIFLTAGTHNAQRVFRGYEVGAVDFLFKPLDPILLRHKVTTFVELHRERLERERLANELRETLRIQETFVAAVSHDLRTPLMTILTGVSVLDDQLDDASSKRALCRMRSSADRMRDMLDQLYDLARARLGGGIPIERRDMDLRVLTEKVLEELRLAYPERTLTADFAEGPMGGYWDEGRLAQVLTNLVGNALRHGAREEGVRVRTRIDGQAIVVEVRNGGTIPEALQKDLFNPFRRGSAESARGGLGLGLYIVQKVVLAHGGQVGFTSSKADGTTFRVHLPRP